MVLARWDQGRMVPGMMGNGPYAGSANNGWQNGYPWPGMGMMGIVVPSTVPAGTVSLRVHNSGCKFYGNRPCGPNLQVFGPSTVDLRAAAQKAGITPV